VKAGLLAGRQVVHGPAVLPRFAVAMVHRSVSLLAVSLLVVHAGTLLSDPYAQLTLVDLVVPFAGTYRPLWLDSGPWDWT
jgi:sulfoxide reductase heme-binding subunit YedZ